MVALVGIVAVVDVGAAAAAAAVVVDDGLCCCCRCCKSNDISLHN